jgi:hypothetical protein
MTPEATPPKVSRFRPDAAPDDPVYTAVPADGLCLNVFVLLSDRANSHRVLLGRIDPEQPWTEIGGMHRQRIQDLGDRWMLPSRQLYLFEAPDEAARSILHAQLGIESLRLEGPQVVSEAWQRPKPAGEGRHWDISFLYRGTWPAGRPLAARPWRELAVHESDQLRPEDVGRSHLDVLDLAGLPTRPR